MLFPKFRFFLFNITLILPVYSYSQSINVGGVFPTIDHSGTITSKIDYSIYYFAALPIVNLDKPDFSNDPYFHLFYAEQALTFNANKKFSVTGSYLYQRANVVSDNYVNENRFYIQTKYKHKLANVNLAHRLRFDARFVENRVTNSSPLTHRLRYLIGLDAPLSKKFYLSLYEEAFLNTVENARVVYEENWAYVGVGNTINEKNKIEIGVLYVTWNLKNTDWFNQYYLQLTWITHLDFRKRQ